MITHNSVGRIAKREGVGGRLSSKTLFFLLSGEGAVLIKLPPTATCSITNNNLITRVFKIHNCVVIIASSQIEIKKKMDDAMNICSQS